MPRTFDGKIKVQISQPYGPRDLKEPDDAKVMRILSFFEHDMSQHGYSVVGEAEVRVTLFDENELITNKVVALNAEAKRITAEAEAKVTSIRRMVNELLAINNDTKPS